MYSLQKCSALTFLQRLMPQAETWWNGHGLTSMARLLHDTNAKLERRRISEVYREMDQRHSLFTSQLAVSVTENVIPDQEILRDPSNAWKPWTLTICWWHQHHLIFAKLRKKEEKKALLVWGKTVFYLFDFFFFGWSMKIYKSLRKRCLCPNLGLACSCQESTRDRCTPNVWTSAVAVNYSLGYPAVPPTFAAERACSPADNLSVTPPYPFFGKLVTGLT